jgi:SRSO17 transposase
MITRGVAAGLTAGWIAADEVYGIDPDLRAELETLAARLRVGYRLQPSRQRPRRPRGVRMRADQVAGLGEQCWTRYSAGAGAKGPASTSGRSSRCIPMTGLDTAGC